MVKTGCEITALDVAPDLLTVARQECAAPNVTFVEGNLEDPHVLPDAYFDMVYGISVLHHVDVPKTLAQLKTKLKPGATFAFSEPNLNNPINKYVYFVDNMEQRKKYGISPTEMAFHAEELYTLFSNAGYTVEHLDHRDFMHPSIPAWGISSAKHIGKLAESLPGVRTISGSIWISGKVRA